MIYCDNRRDIRLKQLLKCICSLSLTANQRKSRSDIAQALNKIANEAKTALETVRSQATLTNRQ